MEYYCLQNPKELQTWKKRKTNRMRQELRQQNQFNLSHNHKERTEQKENKNARLI